MSGHLLPIAGLFSVKRDLVQIGRSAVWQFLVNCGHWVKEELGLLFCNTPTLPSIRNISRLECFTGKSLFGEAN